MTNIIILDLDNTISNDLHRIHLIRKDETDNVKKYHDYHSLALLDKFHWHQAIDGSPFVRDTKFVISTARPDNWRLMTERWLRIHGIPAHGLYMRDEGNQASAVECKKLSLLRILCDYNVEIKDVIAAYDDRPDVIEMYQKYGIKNAKVVSIHNVQIGD